MPRTIRKPDQSSLMAGGLPLDEHIAQQAADWLTLLMSGEASEEDRCRWQSWRGAHPDHERAWLHIEAVMGRIRALEARAAYENLSPYGRQAKPGRRRQLIGLLFIGGLAASTAWPVSRTDTWRQLAADYRTAPGELREIVLADSSRLTLNTDSAVDVRFDAHYRRIRLQVGEIFIATADALGKRADSRPFIVETAEGRVRALGTRFFVRQQLGRTIVSVLESAVELAPAQADEAARILEAGQSLAFSATGFELAGAGQGGGAQAWLRGQIVAEDMRLEDFLAELQRYRSGFVRCAPAVADLRFSGVFPLHDTDRILAALPKVLPVQVRRRTAYWVMVEPI